MFELFFLEGEEPISKTYRLVNGKLEKQSYPFVYNVTSFKEKPSSLQDMAKIIQKHAALGRCMVKGQLHRPLVAESRQGSTNSDDKTEWICLDLDGIKSFESIDIFLDEIGCGEVDYILQWSSSMGIENDSGYRCHIFMLLDKPQHPQLLKYWLMGLNLNKSPTLTMQLELTKIGTALRWPLDISTCQNDKLIYITPPIIGPGIKDPFVTNQRIAFHKRKNRTVTLPYPIQPKSALQQSIDRKVDELREDAGLPKRKKSKYKFQGTTEYMVDPDTATVTGMKAERGFVYFNLNGGDSWAYYHPEDNPNFIRNFKGEPFYRTQDLLPEYWAQLQEESSTLTPNSKGETYIVFRDFRTSNYYNCKYNANTNKLLISQAKSESQLRQFAKQHGVVLGECIPDWDLVWDPHSTDIIDVDGKTLNTYQASDFTQLPTKKINAVPPTIYKIISHVLDYEQPAIEHFLNWLAVIIQHRCATATAWVWQGTEGTGKGILFHKIITPIIGEANVVARRMEELESQFTDFVENKFVVFIDEIEAGEGLYHNKITAKLKNLIVEPTISIRKMYTHAYHATNFSNMIFASNKAEPVTLSPNDRRYNVGAYQKTPLRPTEHEVSELIPAELEDFFHYLRTRPADRSIARTPLMNNAKLLLIDISMTAAQKVSQALLTGDLEFFWQEMPEDSVLLNALEMMKYQPYKELIENITKSLSQSNMVSKLSREDLYIIYNFCVGVKSSAPHRFTSYLKNHRIHLSQIWDNRNVRGIEVLWQPEPSFLTKMQKSL